MIEVKLLSTKMGCYNFKIFYVISYRETNIEYITHTHTHNLKTKEDIVETKDNKALRHKKKQNQKSSVNPPLSSITQKKKVD